ncbi:MAG TPA: DUF1887 family protein, partial [Chromatiaceae bacterium]|nr:DUF1887 family protein [Chromatiaceae bacterium]
MKPRTHLCLVSAQPTPNLTPLLDERTAPARVMLLVSPDMRRQAQWLEEVIRPRGIQVEHIPLEHAFDFPHIQQRVMENLEAVPADERSAIALNATGGTKPMSIAAYEVFRAWDLPIFYVHPVKDHLIWLHPNDLPLVELANRIKLEPFLQAHGARIPDKPRRSIGDRGYLELAEELIVNIRRHRRAIGALNWLAGTADNDELRSEPIESNGTLDELIGLFAEHQLLRREGDRLIFADQAARFFVNGGWLEYHVFDRVRKRRQTNAIQDIAFSVKVQRARDKGNTIDNELDVLFLRENRLHIIECKTRKF